MSTISNLLPSPPDNFSTTLNGSISNSALSIVLNDVTGLGTEGVGVIYQKDTSTPPQPIANTIEFVHWTSIAGSTLTLSDSGDRGLTGSASANQAHSSGDTFEVWVNSRYYSGPRTAMLADHNDAGTHKINVIDAERYGTDVGGDDTYVLTLSPAPAAYAAGMIVNFLPSTGNTGACTLQVNSLAAKSLKYLGNDPLDGHIMAGSLVSAIYDGTNFQIVSPGPTSRVAYVTSASDVTNATGTVTQVSGLTASVTGNGRPMRITAHGYLRHSNSGEFAEITIWDGTVGSGTLLATAKFRTATANQDLNQTAMIEVTPAAAAAKTYNVGFRTTNATGTATLLGTVTPSILEIIGL